MRRIESVVLQSVERRRMGGIESPLLQSVGGIESVVLQSVARRRMGGIESVVLQSVARRRMGGIVGGKEEDGRDSKARPLVLPCCLNFSLLAKTAKLFIF